MNNHTATPRPATCMACGLQTLTIPPKTPLPTAGVCEGCGEKKVYTESDAARMRRMGLLTG